MRRRLVAEPNVIACPHCDKRIRTKTDMSGKNVRCPACEESFLVPKPEPEVKGPPKEDPYGVTIVADVPRCPNCAKEMSSEKAHICIHCGYNTLTRTRGKTVKTVSISGQEHIAHLAPAILAVVGIFVLAGLYFYFCLVLPWEVARSSWRWIDHEGIRMPIGITFLNLTFALGLFSIYRVLTKPMPDERKKD